MRRAVGLWDRINDTGTHEELRALITRRDDAIVYRALVHPLERVHGNEIYKALAVGKGVSSYPARDICRMARRALQIEIESGLSDVATPSYAVPYVTLDLGLVMHPVNLLAYMWLTFARVVSGDIQERRCATTDCPEYVYTGSGPGLQRADAKTHSVSCRQRKKRSGEENNND
jgi:hypothetical protein